MSWKPPYCTIAELKAYLRVPDVQDDSELGLVIGAASSAIDYACNRQFGETDDVEVRSYRSHYYAAGCSTEVQTDDITNIDTVVSVSIDGTTIDSSDLTWLPLNADANDKPYEGLSIVGGGYRTGLVTIEAQWGWDVIPEAIRSATLLQASRFFARRQSPFGVAGSPDMGNELRLLEKLDPDVAVMVKPYRRVWAVA